MYGVSRLDYSRLRELRYPIYGVLMVSIIGVLGAGHGHARREIAGSRCPASICSRPSSARCCWSSRWRGSWSSGCARWAAHTTARVMLLGLLPTMLVMAEPDLGSATVYVAGDARDPVRRRGAVASLRRADRAVRGQRHVRAGGGAEARRRGAQAVPGGAPDGVPAPLGRSGDAGYQQQQSLIAIGSGEKTGRGVENATQTSLGFLPEHHTDFIYAVIGETYGFAGCALVFSLYALLIWRALHILTIAKNLFGALIAGGVAVMLLFQLFVNIGMNVGIMPITGVTAPLLSFGGSSMLSTFLALGLLHSINAQARETADRKGRATIFQ